MALQIEWRNGTAATWTSTNPTLALGEKGVETDTGQFKIGTGTTAWTSLAYSGAVGPTQTLPFRSFGDGSDGNVTISSGTTSLSRDTYYNNLILNGTGTLNTNGWKVFIKGYLDITAAQVGAINWNGTAGGNASGATGGSIATLQTGNTVASNSQGGAGGSGTTTTGGAGVAAPNNLNQNGGVGGAGGTGGASTSAAGAGGGGRSPGVNVPYSRFEASFIYGITLIAGGPGGSGGGAGGGDGTNDGGGGGAGANGGGVVPLFINSIIKSSSTPAGVIQANGGLGGNGANGVAGNAAGGGGGGGGAGGWVYLAYNYAFGPVIPNLIQANGGNAGNAGNGSGTGIGGSGGTAGTGGRINIFNVPNGTSQNWIGGVDNSTLSPELIGTSPIATNGSYATGGNGGFNGILTASL